MLAKSPIATSILEKASGRDSALDSDVWREPIPYGMLPLQFRFSDLVRDASCPVRLMLASLTRIFTFCCRLKKETTESEAAWLSFMRYAGGITYAEEEPEKKLQIPNLVQVQRFAMAVLSRYQLRVTDIEGALSEIATTGDISKLLRCYEKLMVQRDVGFDDFDKTEEHHRDSIYYTLFRNPLLQGHVEFKVTRASMRKSCIIQLT
jgi:hypothetical protein